MCYKFPLSLVVIVSFQGTCHIHSLIVNYALSSPGDLGNDRMTSHDNLSCGVRTYSTWIVHLNACLCGLRKRKREMRKVRLADRWRGSRTGGFYRAFWGSEGYNQHCSLLAGLKGAACHQRWLKERETIHCKFNYYYNIRIEFEWWTVQTFPQCKSTS